jgi:hypothetical protein
VGFALIAGVAAFAAHHSVWNEPPYPSPLTYGEVDEGYLCERKSPR